jgi:hypothetical protein
MASKSVRSGYWSALALRYLVLSIVMTALLSVLDGVMRVLVQSEVQSAFVKMATIWVYDFRFLFEQGILASVVLLVGARIFESRVLMSVGYDLADAKRLEVKGPDDDNTVWVGRRYASPSEAQKVADAFAGQLEAAAKPD